jgi:signal transduction histidine kinase
MAQEVHDGLGQLLTALLCRLRMLQDSCGPGEALAQLADIRQIAARGAIETQRLSRGFHPGIVSDFGLTHALRAYAVEYMRTYDIRVDVCLLNMDEERLPPVVEANLYRLLQEALGNVAKHAQAKTVRIVVERGPCWVKAVLEDDGRGFDVEAAEVNATASRRLGLSGIRDRTALLNGSVAIESRPGTGTTISVTIPLRGQAHASHPDHPGR